jgi:hypothetical protein
LIEFNRTDNSEGDWENSLILLFRVNFWFNPFFLT